MPMVGDYAGPNDKERLISRSSDWMLTHFQLFEQVRKRHHQCQIMAHAPLMMTDTSHLE